jgi:hypothetical protein
MNINFYNLEEPQLLSYHYYVAQVSNNDLLELNGYKIRNILSIVFDKKMRDLVIEDLFNENGTFLSSETKDNLFRYLSSDERNDLKNYLSTYLDYQIESEWYQTITQVLNSECINAILIPTSILNHRLILTHLKTKFSKKKFVDWQSFDETTTALILDYNHVWKKRNIFTLQDSNSNAYFLKHFFESTYQWRTYAEDKNIYVTINTPLRISLFSSEILSEIESNLDELKPKNEQNIWTAILDDDHNSTYNYIGREEIKIHFDKTKANNYSIINSFILNKENKFIIKNATELIDNALKYEGEYKISNLENIILNFEVSKIKEAIQKDESILKIVQPLWQKFNLSENDGRLWKQLLKNKAKEHGIVNVFAEIERLSGVKHFISLHTFEITYCNPGSITIIPRAKKVFKAICQYLELPLEYRAAIHRERNLIGGHSQELHSKLKTLIIAMVDYEIFDQQRNDESLLEILNITIEKIEKRVDIDFFGSTRDALIYACIAVYYEIIDKIKLKPILKIEHITPN